MTSKESSTCEFSADGAVRANRDGLTTTRRRVGSVYSATVHEATATRPDLPLLSTDTHDFLPRDEAGKQTTQHGE